jgi:nucleoside phosphorylase
MSPRRVLIVPALVSEAKAILSFFEDIGVKSTPSGLSYTTGKRKVFCPELKQKPQANWIYLIAPPTEAGNLQASRMVGQLIPECRPNLVALLGCAGGFPGKVDQYDVVVATHVHYVANSKISSRLEVRPLQEWCSRIFVDHCKNVQLLDAWHQYLVPEAPNAPIRVLFEPIVSGETVLANSNCEYYKAATDASPKAVAIEMEGYGFLSACRENNVDAVIIRGISDTLDDKQQPSGDTECCISSAGFDRAQYKATRHAAALFFATLDFVNPSAFTKGSSKVKKELTKVSMTLDAEMHNVTEIEAELFEIFKKYGIKHFSFKPANSIRVEFDAELDAMRIYHSLVRAGIVKQIAGHRFIDFKIKSEKHPNSQLADLIKRIEELEGSTVDALLDAIRFENWIEEFPDYAKILVDTLRHYKKQSKQDLRKKGRILYPQPEKADTRAQAEQYHGALLAPKPITLRPHPLIAELQRREPPKAPNEYLRWFLGDHVLDHDIPIDVLLTLSKRKLFYSWPGLILLQQASSLPTQEFMDACGAEWEHLRGTKGPSVLHMLDQDRWDRLSKTQLRAALEGRPATLSKAVDLLALTSRILAQNDLPPRACIIPSVYALTFNGIIAGDGVVERMLLTGMAGDLQSIADTHGIPLRLLQSAIRGNLLPYQCAVDLACILGDTILNETKLRCATTLANPDYVAAHNRDAAILSPGPMVGRYVAPRGLPSSAIL